MECSNKHTTTRHPKTSDPILDLVRKLFTHFVRKIKGQYRTPPRHLSESTLDEVCHEKIFETQCIR